MDRNSYLSPDGLRLEVDTSEVPPRLSSPPSTQPFLSTAQPETENKVVASGLASARMFLRPPSSWDGSHTPHEMLMVPIMAVSEENLQGHDFLDNTDYRVNLDRMVQSEAMQSHAFQGWSRQCLCGMIRQVRDLLRET